MQRTRHTVKSISPGYTLIELSIVLLVVGIVMSGVATAYNIYVRERAVTNTNISINTINERIGSFLFENGRYPCPAAIDLAPDNPHYGSEADCSALTGYTAAGAVGAPVAVGTCADGICVQEGQRSFDHNISGTGAPDVRRPVVIRGAIPFRALNIPEEQAYDGYGNRLVYALTAKLAVTSSYRSDHGGVSVINGDGQSMTSEPDSAHYIIFSAGPDRKGAYNKNGRQSLPCTGNHLDTINCSIDSSNPVAVYRAAQVSSNMGPNHYDDVSVYASSVDTPFWKVADDNRLNIVDLASGKQIAIGKQPDVSADPSRIRMDVNENIRVSDGGTGIAEAGKVKSQLICSNADDASTECFSTDLIAGETEAMRCGDPGDGGDYMTGVAYNRANCTSETRFSCPDNTFFAGVNSDGSLVCRDITEVASVGVCPAFTDRSCNQDVIVPPGTHGQWLTLRVGWGRHNTYHCSSYDSRWYRQSSDGGYCTCEAQDWQTETYPCDWGYGERSGTITYEWRVVCDETTFERRDEYRNEDQSACVCNNGTTDSWTEACPPGYTGQIVWQDQYICTSPSEGYWTAPQVISHTCTCAAQTEDRTVACPGDPAYVTGSITERRSAICPPPPSGNPWTPWAVVSNTCTCTPTTETRGAVCPVGTSGTAVERRTLQCPGGTFTPWVLDTTGCVCTPEVVERDFPCDTGYTGTVRRSSSYTCPGPVAGPWVDVSSNCQAVFYRWKPVGTPSGQSMTGSGAEVNSICSPQGATSSCYSLISGGGGLKNNYAECKCQ